MSKNKVTFGLDKVHIAFIDTASEELAWETPIAIPGAVGWSPEPQGESSTFYADNTAYFVVNSNNGYTGELEIALIPDAILAEMLGWEIDSNGALIEVSNAIPKKFALIGQILGDASNRRFVYYNCIANRPSKELATKGESTEVNADTLSVTISPIEVGDKMIVRADLELNETNATAFNGFFGAVYKPATGGGA